MVSSPMAGCRSIVPLVSIFALIASATVAACGRGQQAPLADYAVYAEYSLSNKPMVAGWKTRVFNKKEVQEGGEDQPRRLIIPTSLTPPAGYARLRYLEDALAPDVVPTVDVINASNAKVLSVGTGSDANALPSFMETFLTVKDKANLVVEHQVGAEVKDLYLQVNANGSVWHVNARISIQRL